MRACRRGSVEHLASRFIFLYPVDEAVLLEENR